jgi:hypothetical protein
MSTINTCRPLLLTQERGRRKSDSKCAKEGCGFWGVKEGCEFWGVKKVPILGF